VLETSARLLRLLSLLQTHRDWSGADLADRLGVTPRTVRRDVDKLRNLGYPVHGSTGTTGGYRLGAGAALPPLLLDDEEAVAVAAGLRTAAGGAITGIEETSVRALAKLEQVLPARLRRRVQALTAYTVSVPVRPGPTVDAGVLTAIAGAARDHVRLRFDYTAHDGRTGLRATEPHRLVSWGRRWYLVAWDVDRQDWRTFRCDRISEPATNGMRFAVREPPAEDIGEYVSKGARQAQARLTGHLIVHAPAADIAGKLGSSFATIEPIDETSCRIEIGASSYESLANWLSFLDADFQVIGPPELTQAVSALAARYQRGIGFTPAP
jgi:predicted DNA-binding transcriptional regulator YafY